MIVNADQLRPAVQRPISHRGISHRLRICHPPGGSWAPGLDRTLRRLSRADADEAIDPGGRPVGARQDHGRLPAEKLVQAFAQGRRSEEHTSELQSLMRISYAVFCLKKKTQLAASLQKIPLIPIQHTQMTTEAEKS